MKFGYKAFLTLAILLSYNISAKIKLVGPTFLTQREYKFDTKSCVDKMHYTVLKTKVLNTKQNLAFAQLDLHEESILSSYCAYNIKPEVSKKYTDLIPLTDFVFSNKDKTTNCLGEVKAVNNKNIIHHLSISINQLESKDQLFTRDQIQACLDQTLELFETKHESKVMLQVLSKVNIF
jgi:hypothetical protein